MPRNTCITQYRKTIENELKFFGNPGDVPFKSSGAAWDFIEKALDRLVELDGVPTGEAVLETRCLLYDAARALCAAIKLGGLTVDMLLAAEHQLPKMRYRESPTRQNLEHARATYHEYEGPLAIALILVYLMRVRVTHMKSKAWSDLQDTRIFVQSVWTM